MSKPGIQRESEIQKLIRSQTNLETSLLTFGICPKPPAPDRLNSLRALSDSQMLEVGSSIQLLNQYLENSKAKDLRNTERMLSYTLGALKLQSSTEFISTLDSEDIVEGYAFNNRQIFRNFKFMEICGYSLLDLLTAEWPMLFERTQSITDALLGRLAEVMKTGQTLSLMNLPVHYMKERKSADRQVVEVQFRYMGPLFDGPEKPAGVLCSCKARIVDETPDRHELRFI